MISDIDFMDQSIMLTSCTVYTLHIWEGAFILKKGMHFMEHLGGPVG